MTADELRAKQAPLKARYQEDPASARKTLTAVGTIDPATLSCRVETGHGPTVNAGLHPAAGGDGTWACSGDMLLQALAGCAGVTLAAVATALGMPLRGGRVTAEGDVDFRGTLGVKKDAPVGFEAIRLRFTLDSDAGPEQLAKVLQLTERYCVVAQSIKPTPTITGSLSSDPGAHV
jgi:uncharacterized OsmC-like protein